MTYNVLGRALYLTQLNSLQTSYRRFEAPISCKLPYRKRIWCTLQLTELRKPPSFDIQVKFYRDCLRGNPPSGELNTRGVAVEVKIRMKTVKFTILDLSNAISRKRSKIGAKFVLITNRKSHISFRLVPNSVTLDDLERRNSPNGSIISTNSVALGADYVKVVQYTPIRSTAEM